MDDPAGAKRTSPCRVSAGQGPVIVCPRGESPGVQDGFEVLDQVGGVQVLAAGEVHEYPDRLSE
jgi:hypothetical protein